MGLKPTQYRCASESLLRRLRKEGELPRIHPVVDLCNALSVAYGVPVAALDVDRISGPLLEVRHALGDEHYTTFGGDTEHPAPGEVTFVDSMRPGTPAAGPTARAATPRSASTPAGSSWSRKRCTRAVRRPCRIS